MALDRDTTFTWYGHACFEVRTPGGTTILIDPWFGNPQSPRTADSVDRCDLLLVTHGHGDHMGDAVALASRLRPAWPCIHEMSLWLGRRLPGGSDAVIGMNKGGTVEVAGIKITMIHADHSAGDWNAERRDDRSTSASRPGFVVELENGFRIYHAGDTDVFGDMRLIGELLPARPRPAADRRPLHDGPPRGGPGRRAARRQARHADPLRHVPDPGRDAGGARARSWTPAVSVTSRSMRPEPGGRVVLRSTNGASAGLNAALERVRLRRAQTRYRILVLLAIVGLVLLLPWRARRWRPDSVSPTSFV